MSAAVATWSVAGAATAGVILRPGGLPEAIPAVAGAAALVAFGLLTPELALAGVEKGTDVYLFLAGMMLLAEVARREGLFDWLARGATGFAKGSPTRLFGLVYAVGILVTALMSNDATAVVLTPAVLAAAKAAEVADPLPYALISAFVANAASFVLPISNPANLVVFGAGRMPPLTTWIACFAAPSIAAVAVTFVALYLTQRAALRRDTLAETVKREPLAGGGRLAAAGILLTSLALVAASAFGLDLGAPTAIAGALTAGAALARRREAPWPLLKGISWSVLPLVAGLFVLVEALQRTGVVAELGARLAEWSQASPQASAASAGALVALVGNLVNNLPAGLFAGAAVRAAEAPPQLTSALLIGVDLGPNLSVTGSLATILWLHALRREDIGIGAWRFLKLGAVVMTPALAAALAALLLI